MEGTGFLKTVNFGGFDKKDVLAYVDDLNTKIYTLEQELEEKKNQIASGGGSASSEEANEELQKQHSADLAKIGELKAAGDSLRMQVKSLEDEVATKNKEINTLKDKCTELEDKLASAPADSGETTAFDISGVFMEAKKSADKIVLEARNLAKKTEHDANELADKVVGDANVQAASIIRTADASAKKSVSDAEMKAKSILNEAETKSAEMLSSSEAIKETVTTELAEIEMNVSKLSDVLEHFSKESIGKISETKQMINQAQNCMKNGTPYGGSASSYSSQKSSSYRAPEPMKQAEPVREQPQAVKPAPAPAPVQAKPVENKPAMDNQQVKRKNFIDMGELDEITKAIEAAEANKGGPRKPGEVDM